VPKKLSNVNIGAFDLENKSKDTIYVKTITFKKLGNATDVDSVYYLEFINHWDSIIIPGWFTERSHKEPVFNNNTKILLEKDDFILKLLPGKKKTVFISVIFEFESVGSTLYFELVKVDYQYKSKNKNWYDNLVLFPKLQTNIMTSTNMGDGILVYPAVTFNPETITDKDLLVMADFCIYPGYSYTSRNPIMVSEIVLVRKGTGKISDISKISIMSEFSTAKSLSSYMKHSALKGDTITFKGQLEIIDGIPNEIKVFVVMKDGRPPGTHQFKLHKISGAKDTVTDKEVPIDYWNPVGPVITLVRNKKSKS
jgi:hypothetical protein